MTDTLKQARWWVLYEKLPRPTLRWVSLAAFVWVFAGSDLAGVPLDAGNRLAILTFIAGIYGVRAFERLKGIAS